MDVDQEYKSAARRSVVLLTVLGALSQLLGFGYRVAPVSYTHLFGVLSWLKV